MIETDDLEAHWQGIGDGPYVSVEDLLKVASGQPSPPSGLIRDLKDWKAAVIAGRLAEVAESFPDATVSTMQRDLVKLHGELEE